MNNSFQLPQGICAIKEASGLIFTPVAGYTISPAIGEKWTHVVRAACTLEDIEPIMSALVEVCLPKTCYAILCGHWFEDRVDTFLSDFLMRSQIEDVFSTHLSVIIQDGMVGYGFACYDPDRHEEIFLDDHKELTLLTSVPGAVAEVFSKFGIPKNQELEFLSQHGHAHLNIHGLSRQYCEEIIEELGMKSPLNA